MRIYNQEQIRLEVHVIGENNKPFLNVYLEDGTWFHLNPKGMMCPEDSKVHPEVYKRVWGKTMPSPSSTDEHKERTP